MYLTVYELRRARQKLIELGGTPRLTEEEREMLRFYRKVAEEFGWTDKPPGIARSEEWEATERGEEQLAGE